MMLAWENLWEVFVLLLFIFDVVYLFPRYFAMSPALHPGFSDPWRSPPALSYTPIAFLFRALRFWVGISYLKASFTLRPFPTFLAHSRHFCFYQIFGGSWRLLSWKLQDFILIFETQTRPICFVWFTVIHNLLYILSLYLCMSILQKLLFVVKTLIRSAATLFNNHENIKLQPNSSATKT